MSSLFSPRNALYPLRLTHPTCSVELMSKTNLFHDKLYLSFKIPQTRAVWKKQMQVTYVI